MIRTAVIKDAADLDTVLRMLPSNYSAERTAMGDILITGMDTYDCTLHEHVLPKFADTGFFPDAGMGAPTMLKSLGRRCPCVGGPIP